jgi:hypothetical protein
MANEKRSSTQVEQVTFSSGNLVLHGFIHKPEGNGLFPAILLNHGSEQFPKSGQIIAEPYVQNDYDLTPTQNLKRQISHISC